MGPELFRLGVSEARDGLRAGRFSSEELAQACLARIRALEGNIRAWAWLDPAEALARARRADRQAQGGSLQGIPFGVKDVIGTRAIPTRMGSPIFADNVPTASASVVLQMEQAGAFVLGKTVTAELAFLAPGGTRNPWNLEHTPGGSSMGSAAAVAACMVPAALGTQTNGSVIRPAAYCGVIGFKPSAGQISCQGILEFSHTLDQVGVFARSVEDAALVATCLMSAGRAAPDLGPRLLVRPPRLAAVRSPVWHYAQPEQQERFGRDLEILRGAGARVDEIELPAVFGAAHDTQRTIMRYEGAHAFATLQAAQRDWISAELNALIDDGRGIPAAAYRAALEERARLSVALGDVLRDYDAIVTPPARGEAPATLANTGDPVFCTIWTLCGAPAITIPSGLGPQGMPLGLQIVGAHLDDARTLAVAHWCVGQIGFSHCVPD